MSNTYYSSLSGMLAASFGLQNTSNNLANMQSHGFKRSDVFYSSLGNGNGDEGLGHGVRVHSTAINFSEGNCLQTESESNLAILGQGFFVIRLKNNQLVYTRNGDFEFQNGILFDRNTRGEVQGFNEAGNLVPIHEKGPKTTPGKRSRDIFLKGTFVAHKVDEKKSNEPPGTSTSEPGKTPKSYENVIFKLDKIYDAQGKPHIVQFEFEEDDSPSPKTSICLSWKLVNITCSDAKITFSEDQKLQFYSQGSGQNSNDSIHFSLDDNIVNVNLGTDKDDSYVKIEQMAVQTSQTEIEICKNDGYGEGRQYNYSFDKEGQITYLYDNGQIVKGIYVVLARFDDMEHNLVQTQDNVFKAKSDKGIHYGRPNKMGFASILPKQLECANVDSTTEFANIVVLQRMFQACSQIMDIDKQLLEELESKL